MALAWRSFFIGEKVPAIGACYAFFGDGKLLYIGSTCNLFSRMVVHKINSCLSRRDARFKFDTIWGEFKSLLVKYRPAKKYGDWAMVELRLTRRLKPFGNKQNKLQRKTCTPGSKKNRLPRGMAFSSSYRARF